MKETIYTLRLGIADAFIIKGEKYILVDTGMNVPAGKFKALFDEYSINPRDIGLIIITHGHADHYAHIKELQQMTGAQILCHKNAVNSLTTGDSTLVKARNTIGKIAMKFLKGEISGYQPVTPEIVIDDEYDLSQHGVKGRIVYTPGHSDCSISVVTDAGNVFIGDLLMGSFFSTAKPTLGVFGLDDAEMIRSVQKLVDAGGTVFYASHRGKFKQKAIRKLIKRYTK